VIEGTSVFVQTGRNPCMWDCMWYDMTTCNVIQLGTVWNAY